MRTTSQVDVSCGELQCKAVVVFFLLIKNVVLLLEKSVTGQLCFI